MSLTTDKKPLDSLHKAPSSQIKVNGEILSANYEINKITTFKEVNKLSRARIIILGGDHTKNTFEESEDKIFDIGNEIEIKLGYDQKYTLVFEGIIVKHSISIKEGFVKTKSKSKLIIECADKAIMLKNTYTSAIFKEKTDNQIINNIINNVPGLDASVDSTDYEYTVLPKYNSNDWNFILERAKYNGFFVLNSNNKITIKDPNVGAIGPAVNITNGTGTISFAAHLDSENQFNTLKLVSRDSFNNETYSKVGSEPNDINTNDTNTSKSLSRKTSPSEVEINLPHDIDSNELKGMADSLTKISRFQRISGNAKFKGVLDIDLDMVVNLKGFGNRFDGNVYISAVSHEIEEGRIYTEIEFGMKEDFLNQRNIFDKNQITNSISGLHIGQVGQIHNDPENQYRIKVQIPSLNDIGDGIWAKLTHFYSGTESGVLFIPEVGTQVVVSFIANESRFPVVLGCLYTNDKKPAESILEENDIKCFVTKNKLKISFNEKNKEISISTPAGNTIILNEENKEISIEDQNNNFIKTSPSGIELNSGKDIKITSSGTLQLNAKGKISLSSNSDVNIEGLNITQSADVKFSAKANSNVELTSSGIAVFKGSLVQIN